MPRKNEGGEPVGEALEDIVSGAIAEWERLQGDTPDLLYHYTDVAGLIGICSSRSLWATNLRFMTLEDKCRKPRSSPK